MRMKDSASASRLFFDAMAQNPAYEPAYQGLIEVYKQIGDKSGILELATSGLRHLPNSVALREAYLEAGGKKPFPEPIAKPLQQEDSAGGVLKVPSASDKETKETTTESQSPADTEVTTEDLMERGCRFCTPEEIQNRWRESFRARTKP